MKTRLRTAAAVVGLFALVLQYGLILIEPKSQGLLRWTLNYFSFFTILTNWMAALAMLLPLVAPSSRAARFAERPDVRTAITGYIIVVFAVYVLLLRQQWSPSGLDRMTDILMHYVTPALFVLDWLLFVPKGQVSWHLVRHIQVFPLLFMGWTLTHGAWTRWYPYPFMDVTKIGLAQVLRNGGGLAVVFLVLTLVLLGVDRAIARYYPGRSVAA